MKTQKNVNNHIFTFHISLNTVIKNLNRCVRFYLESHFSHFCFQIKYTSKCRYSSPPYFIFVLSCLAIVRENVIILYWSIVKYCASNLQLKSKLWLTAAQRSWNWGLLRLWPFKKIIEIYTKFLHWSFLGCFWQSCFVS